MKYSLLLTVAAAATVFGSEFGEQYVAEAPSTPQEFEAVAGAVTLAHQMEALLNMITNQDPNRRTGGTQIQAKRRFQYINNMAYFDKRGMSSGSDTINFNNNFGVGGNNFVHNQVIKGNSFPFRAKRRMNINFEFNDKRSKDSAMINNNKFEGDKVTINTLLSQPTTPTPTANPTPAPTAETNGTKRRMNINFEFNDKRSKDSAIINNNKFGGDKVTINTLLSQPTTPTPTANPTPAPTAETNGTKRRMNINFEFNDKRSKDNAIITNNKFEGDKVTINTLLSQPTTPTPTANPTPAPTAETNGTKRRMNINFEFNDKRSKDNAIITNNKFEGDKVTINTLPNPPAQTTSTPTAYRTPAPTAETNDTKRRMNINFEFNDKRSKDSAIITNNKFEGDQTYPPAQTTSTPTANRTPAPTAETNSTTNK